MLSQKYKFRNRQIGAQEDNLCSNGKIRSSLLFPCGAYHIEKVASIPTNPMRPRSMKYDVFYVFNERETGKKKAHTHTHTHLASSSIKGSSGKAP